MYLRQNGWNVQGDMVSKNFGKFIDKTKRFNF